MSPHKTDWEDLATLDPMWAILSEPDKRGGNWDAQEFFRTGADEVDMLMRAADALGLPAQHRRALDFGCGLGRVTRALSARFSECHGVDIAEEMVRRARELTPGCHFHVNSHPDLNLFPDEHFDLVHCVIVLQHQPTRAAIRGYLREFMRVLAPGGLLVFQLPCRIPWKNRIQPRRRVYALLRACGVPMQFLFRLGLDPVRMNFVPEQEVKAVITSSGGEVLSCEPDRWCAPYCDSRTYYCGKSGLQPAH